MEQEQKEALMHDWAISGLSIRNLANKYGISPSRVHRIMRAKKEKKDQKMTNDTTVLSSEVTRLQALLRKEQLKNELLNNMIDIADKELGTNIRKKSGTRQSE